MRRTVLIVMLAVAALIVATAVPAGAAKAEKTPYIVAECNFTPLHPGIQWVTGQNNLHIRGAMNRYNEWVLEGEDWREIGTNTTTANGNVKLPDFIGPFWGTFSFADDGTIGNFEGSWSWGNSALGRASAKEVDGDKLLKVTLGLDAADYPAFVEGMGECGVAEFLVINPKP